MAPRAYWKGYLRLSLVTCPIELFPATSQSEKTHFHQINTQTGHRLRQQMVDEATGKVVDKAHKGRGYELAKGRYVQVDEDELAAVEIESTHTIDIDSFVPLAEIDKRYLDKPYYMVPDGKVGAEAFAVIRDAMKDKDRVGLARIVMSNREHIIALEPLGNGHDAALRLRGTRRKGLFRRGVQPARAEGNARTCRAYTRNESWAFRSKKIRMSMSWRCGS